MLGLLLQLKQLQACVIADLPIGLCFYEIFTYAIELEGPTTVDGLLAGCLCHRWFCPSVALFFT